MHRIGARAEQRVTNELVNAFKRVSGKENILFHIAEASLVRPDGQVRAVVFPAVRGGEQTLKELVREYKTKGPVYRRTVQTMLKGSYTNHYRRGLVALLEVLEFRSNNTLYRPVVEALESVKRHAKAGNTTYYPPGETAPTHRGHVRAVGGVYWHVNRGSVVVQSQILRSSPSADAAMCGGRFAVLGGGAQDVPRGGDQPEPAHDRDVAGQVERAQVRVAGPADQLVPQVPAGGVQQRELGAEPGAEQVDRERVPYISVNRATMNAD